MNELTIFNNNQLTMSSIEIATLTGKRHDNVMLDIDKLLKYYQSIYSPEKSGQLLKSDTYKDSSGKRNKCYQLSKDAALDLVTGYSLPHRHAVNQRWLELESAQAPKLPTTYIEALEALVQTEKAKQAALAQIERDKPKVEVANCLTEKTDSYYIRDWVKRMKDEYKLIVGERAVIDWLIGQHYIYRDELRRLTHYAKYESNGRNYFTVNSEIINNRLDRVIQITGKGISALTKKVIKTFSGTNIKNHTNLELWESRY